MQLVDHPQGFIAGEDGGEAFGTLGGRKQNGLDLLVEYFTIEEEDCGEGLVSPAPTAGAVWVEAATLRCVAR